MLPLLVNIHRRYRRQNYLTYLLSRKNVGQAEIDRYIAYFFPWKTMHNASAEDSPGFVKHVILVQESIPG